MIVKKGTNQHVPFFTTGSPGLASPGVLLPPGITTFQWTGALLRTATTLNVLGTRKPTVFNTSETRTLPTEYHPSFFIPAKTQRFTYSLKIKQKIFCLGKCLGRHPCKPCYSSNGAFYLA